LLIKNLYNKKFTNILNFIQKEKIIQYDLCETGDECGKNIVSYGVRVKSFCEGVYEEEYFLNISTDKTFIENIIKYLYENSLDVINFKDVVNDLLFKLKVIKEKFESKNLENGI
jgi:hypothetical protein